MSRTRAWQRNPVSSTDRPSTRGGGGGTDDFESGGFPPGRPIGVAACCAFLAAEASAAAADVAADARSASAADTAGSAAAAASSAFCFSNARRCFWLSFGGGAGILNVSSPSATRPRTGRGGSERRACGRAGGCQL